jgi:protein O-mannosyl-transferase
MSRPTRSHENCARQEGLPPESGKANDCNRTCPGSPLRVKKRVSLKTLPGRTPILKRFLPFWQGILIVLFVFIAYFPAWHGEFVWDDDAWTTGRSELYQSSTGLSSIWLNPTTLQQYYPLTGTSFWLDYQLWQFWTLPYHLENILLHAVAALIFWRVLLRLQLPGAWLAAALFALHPVMVESVAWITERKNVLSMAFYLGALLAYLRYAEKSTARSPESKVFHGLALILFFGALLAKTATFSLPAVILLIGWWQRGRVRWQADVLPTLPFFALALSFCALTGWLEKYHVGAQGADFALTFPQRCLIAGRAFWFYLGHLFWPANLCFIYPRWQPDPGRWWQWLYPAAALGALLALWLARGRIGRGPVTALFYFVGTLFPVMGFMNAYGMRFSFVWDHWVYLPALGIFALAAAGVAQAAGFLRKPAAVYGFGAIVLPVLALLTWRQAGMYRDVETLWQTTLDRNPACWLAQDSLGQMLVKADRIEEAMDHFHEAIRLNPYNADPLNNLAWVLAASSNDKIRNGAEAVRLAERACELTHYREAVFVATLAAAYAECGRFPEAVATGETAVQLATAAGLMDLAEKTRQLLEFYHAGKPYHQPAAPE